MTKTSAIGVLLGAAAFLLKLAHDAEMYGITTVCLRAKNIVPPSTARQKAR